MEQGRLYPVSQEGSAVKRFARDANRIGRLTIPLDNALDKKEFKIGGTFLWAYDATDNDVSVDIAFRQEQADEGITFKKRSSIAGVPFESIFVTSAAQAGKVIKLCYAVESADQIRINNSGEGTTEVTVVKGATTTQSRVTVGAASGTLLAADGDRRRALIRNHSLTEGFYMRDDSAAATTANGFYVGPGETVEYLSTDGLNAIRENAIDVAVSILIEKD